VKESPLSPRCGSAAFCVEGILSTASRNYATVCDLFRRWRRVPSPTLVPVPSTARGEGCRSMEK
jgi:hypothetical protein